MLKGWTKLKENIHQSEDWDGAGNINKLDCELCFNLACLL